MKSSKLKIVTILLAITNVVTLVLLITTLGKNNLFQAKVELSPPQHEAAEIVSHCESVQILSLPEAPLPANTSAVLRLQVEPQNFQGAFSFSASSGTFNDLEGNNGSLIDTNANEVTYSGGEADAVITVQAQGIGNEHCIATLPIVAQNKLLCSSLKLNVYPSPLPPDQSAEIKIIPVPANFSGNFLVQADSGKLQINDADAQANGNNTNILITNSKSVLYNGGKSGEKITVRALGEQNNACAASLQISKK